MEFPLLAERHVLHIVRYTVTHHTISTIDYGEILTVGFPGADVGKAIKNGECFGGFPMFYCGFMVIFPYCGFPKTNKEWWKTILLRYVGNTYSHVGLFPVLKSCGWQ